jgi:hypothetical protein
MQISPHQALRAASYLLKIGYFAMEEDCRGDISSMMQRLKNVLDVYESYLQKNYRLSFKDDTVAAVMEQKLYMLTEVVNSLASLLLPEAQAQMEAFIANLKLPDPVPPYPISNSVGLLTKASEHLRDFTTIKH